MKRLLSIGLLLLIGGCDGVFDDATELVEFRPDEGIGYGELINVSEPGIDPDAPLDPTKPTIVITHGANPMADLVRFTYPQAMAEAIYERCPGAVNLCWWDFNRASLAGGPLLIAFEQGHLLAQELLDRGVGAELQLIGHSQGTMVVAVAASELGWVDQLTLLDTTLTRNGWVYGVIPSVEHCGELENYWGTPPTGLGGPVELPGIFSREVTETPRTKVPPTIIEFLPSHINVMLYYLDTIRDPTLSDGFNRSVFVNRCSAGR